jgi:hypothetical protein
VKTKTRRVELGAPELRTIIAALGCASYVMDNYPKNSEQTSEVWLAAQRGLGGRSREFILRLIAVFEHERSLLGR